MVFFYIVLIFFLLFLWIWIDFSLGMKNHLKQKRSVKYPYRKADTSWFDTGSDFYEGYFEDVNNATDHVHILFYIFRNDSIGDQLIDLLIQKAAEGVTVRVLIDRIGSGLSRAGRKKMENAGIQFAYSHRIQFPYLFYSLNRRNHRKITVIDGKIGYSGGFNIGDEYMGRDPKLGFWRDFHLRFQGDGVQDLQTQFIKDWSREKPQTISQDSRYYPELTEGENSLRFFSTGGEGLAESFAHAIQQAKQYIYIASPYFIPTPSLQKALLASMKRGVKVHILLPEKRDHPLVKEASFSYLEELLQAGAYVYHFQDGFFHAKALLIDDYYCDTGSANFDRRSFYLNNEMNTLLFDPVLIHTVKQSIEKDMEQSTLVSLGQLKKRSFFTRCIEALSKWFEPIL